MIRVIIFFVVICNSLLWGKQIQIVPMQMAPQPENVEINILYPKQDEILEESILRIRVRGFALGIASTDARADELPSSEKGQTLHIVIDNKPYFPVAGPTIDEYEDQGKYNEGIYDYSIPFSLTQGPHLIRVFACRSYGESLKEENCFDMASFYLGKKRKNFPLDLKAPLLTYNEPGGKFHVEKGSPILLDFYLTNCVLSIGGYRVKVYIDGQEQKTLYRWCPYYIYGLEEGTHRIRLQLVNARGEIVQKEYNDIERVIKIL